MKFKFLICTFLCMFMLCSCFGENMFFTDTSIGLDNSYFMMLIEEKTIMECFDKIHYFDEGSGDENIILFSNNPIKNLTVTATEYTPDDTFVGTKELYFLDELPKNQAFHLRTVTPEGIPFLKISFIDINGNKVENLIAYDGRLGGVSPKDNNKLYDFIDNKNFVVENEFGYDVLAEDGTKISIYALDVSPSNNKVAYISPFEFEERGEVYVFDLNTKQNTKIDFDVDKDYTPKYVSWFDDENLIIIEMFATGTITMGGDVFIYNLKTGTQKKILASKSEFVTISEAKVYGDKLLITVSEYLDNNFMEHSYYNLFINTADINLLNEDIIYIDKFKAE